MCKITQSPIARRSHKRKDGGDEVKESVLTRGGPTSREVVTTNSRKSAEAILAMSMREGPNKTIVKVGGTQTQALKIRHKTEAKADRRE